MTTTISQGASWLAANVGYDLDECLDWPFGWKATGYGAFELAGKRVRAHRYMCELAHGAPPTSKHEAAHACDRRVCVNPKHLRWATHAENMADTRGKRKPTSRPANFRQVFGSRHGRARLSEQDIADIRERIELRLATQKQLAREFGVHRSTISLAASGKNWSHV